MTTAQKIRVFRVKRGMTQKRLGELCGIADSVIRRYEADKLHPKYETLQKIADAFEVDVKELLPDSEPVLEIGSNIKRERKRLGITQEELAARAGCSPIGIRRYETNTRTPKAEILRRIAKALDVDINVLVQVRESENRKPNESVSERKQEQITEGTLADAIQDLGYLLIEWAARWKSKM